jgi:hypothetical protein
MTEHDEQLERLREAVDRKSADAKAASESTRHSPADRAGDEDGTAIQSNIVSTGEQQDTFSARDKNTQHGKKTADKWNQ